MHEHKLLIYTINQCQIKKIEEHFPTALKKGNALEQAFLCIYISNNIESLRLINWIEITNI